MPTGDGDPFGLEESLRVARSFLSQPAEAGYDALDALVAVCLDNVPGAEAAAISYAGHGLVRSTHLTDPLIGEIDRWHTESGRGPLLDQALAGSSHRQVLVVDDLTFEIVSGEVTVEVTPPFRTLHSTTLRCQDGHRTALDLYAARPRALGLDATAMADLFAQRATRLLYGPDEAAAARFHLAVNLISRCLDLARAEAEELLTPHLEGGRQDPVVVAERIIDHITGTDPER
ncbi:hypothetical protein [Actinomycetospora cinnamomea]|uniref:ANTAR domain-containing protein n=1 Tax=Actinomycetospora cinnamomea TaxID=663609 RepID=A0A2U1EBD6_9PSEU|nr:hypothetical protein [Actinomycetospora cinnamomea]PVY97263.1 hypothetical protein C8D89_1255 [Actinomycetospora cinnamomea]